MIAAPVRKKVLQACAVLLLRSKIFNEGCECYSSQVPGNCNTSPLPICQRKNPVRANSAAASADAPQRKHRHMIMTGKFKNHQGE